MAKTTTKNNGSSANIGFEAKLWLAADSYTHVVLGLFFLDYIFDAFEDQSSPTLSIVIVSGLL